jgi:hypothetical protein
LRRTSKSALFAAVRAWDAATSAAIVGAVPTLVHATDPKGRMALHVACAVKPGREGLGEADGIGTVTALLDAGADLEAAVPMDADEGDFCATPLWYAVDRGGRRSRHRRRPRPGRRRHRPGAPPAEAGDRAPAALEGAGYRAGMMAR